MYVRLSILSITVQIIKKLTYENRRQCYTFTLLIVWFILAFKGNRNHMKRKDECIRTLVNSSKHGSFFYTNN